MTKLMLIYVIILLSGYAKCDDSTLYFRSHNALGGLRDNWLCPDKQSTCPRNSTCCMQTSGKYGCCPFPNAVCCGDFVHCCPSNTQCDTQTGQCQALKTAEQPIQKVTSGVPASVDHHKECPDYTLCSSDDKCCPFPGGEYMCCPYSKGTCCLYKQAPYCCDVGYSCNMGDCVKPGNTTENDHKTSSASYPTKLTIINPQNEASLVSSEGPNKECPDLKTQCPDSATCCMTGKFTYSCCYITEAVCCTGFPRCCDKNYYCINNECVKGNITKPAYKMDTSPHLTRQQQAVASTEKTNNLCPDKSKCPKENTCCSVGGGEYKCCPLPKATCCNDGRHCCPQNYRCETQRQRCVPEAKGGRKSFLDYLISANSMP